MTDCFIAPYLLTYLHTHTNTCHIRPSPKIAHRAADAAASSLSPIATIMHVTQLTYWTKPRRHGEEGGFAYRDECISCCRMCVCMYTMQQILRHQRVRAAGVVDVRSTAGQWQLRRRRRCRSQRRRPLVARHQRQSLLPLQPRQERSMSINYF